MGITMKYYGGAPGNRGRFSFSRRAHLLTTCKTGGGSPPVGQARALFTKCLSAASPEGAGKCRKRTLPVQLAAMFFLNIKTVVKQPANCLRKPATGSFVADMGIASPATPIFFLRKRNKSKGKVRTNGNLPSGSKSSQPGQWAFCCCRFRLFKLFQDVE